MVSQTIINAGMVVRGQDHSSRQQALAYTRKRKMAQYNDQQIMLTSPPSEGDMHPKLKSRGELLEGKSADSWEIRGYSKLDRVGGAALLGKKRACKNVGRIDPNMGATRSTHSKTSSASTRVASSSRR